jgi:aryl-alcohol dehydrogenase-like predicted oxidoreductase
MEKIREEIKGTKLTIPQTAVKFTLAHPAVSTVITGIRNVRQAEENTAIADLPDLPEDLLLRLRKHAWVKAFWYGGK